MSMNRRTFGKAAAASLLSANGACTTLLRGRPLDTCDATTCLLRSYSGVHQANAAVVRPKNLSQLSDVMTSERSMTFRAGGYSFDKQSLPRDGDGVSISLLGLNDIQSPKDGTITVEPGASWADILDESLAHGLVPSIMVTGSGTTAGGTVSSNGLSRFSPRYGKAASYIESFDLMTPKDGKVITVRPSDELFAAVVGGFGYFGAVTSVTYALRPVPSDPVARTELLRTRSVEELVRVLIATTDELSHSKMHSTATTGQSYPRCREDDRVASGSRYGKRAACGVSVYNRSFFGSFEPNETVYSSAYILRGDMRGYVARSRYVSRAEDAPSPFPLYEDSGVLLEIAKSVFDSAAEPRAADWWMHVSYTLGGELSTFENDLPEFTFFMDLHAQVKRQRDARATGDDVPVFVIQQTFVIPADLDGQRPAVESTVSRDRYEADLTGFLRWLVYETETAGLVSAFLDVLYIPSDKSLLSASYDRAGFAVSVAFEYTTRAHIAAIQRVLERMSMHCLTLNGRVHLTKNVFAAPGVLAQMYERDRLREVRRLKAHCDPERRIKSRFLDDLFGTSV